MNRWAVLVALAAWALVMASVGCGRLNVGAEEPRTITLTSSEKQASQAIAIRRDTIQQERNEVTATYQASMNRLAEKEQQLNNDAFKLCLQFRRQHELSSQAVYRLEEWKGELVKQ